MEDEILLQKIGERIKDLRAKQGLSQQELAARLNYEKSNMSRLESGKTNPRLTTLNLVAKALGVPLTDLFTVV